MRRCIIVSEGSLINRSNQSENENMLSPRTIGRTGLQVSALCLGANHFGNEFAGCDQDESHRVIDAAFDHGIAFIDTANVYANGRSETIIGDYFQKNGDKKDKIVVATKFGYSDDGYDEQTGRNDQGPSPHNIVRSVESSLRRLKRDHIDILYMHTWFEPAALENTLTALDALVRQGKILQIGCSNFPTWLLARSLWLSDVRRLARFELVQSLYNALIQDIAIELTPFARAEGVAVVAYSPLASGVLTGKHPTGAPAPIKDTTGERAKKLRAGLARLYFDERRQAFMTRLRDIARKYDAPLTTLALDWTLNSGATCCIVGARDEQQIRQTAEMFAQSPPAEARAEFAKAADEWRAASPLRYPPKLGDSFIDEKARQRI